MLHITNGASVSLADSGLGGEILFWTDNLCEGPVPTRLSPADLTRLRDTYFHARLLTRRDEALAGIPPEEDIVLWFEHDLYDQLQLIQVLDYFAARQTGALKLIAIEGYLGALTGAQLAELWPQRRPVPAGAFELASAAWAAFRSPDPTGIERLLRQDTAALPHLAPALVRHLEQFPSVENGLNRTERQILAVVEAGHRTPHAMFRADQQLEPAIFLGFSTFEAYLRGMAECRQPLVEEAGGEFRLTQVGRDVLGGRADHIRLNGINRWLGGVHLEGVEARWRWSETSRALVLH